MNKAQINGKTYRGIHSINVTNNRVVIDGKQVDVGKVENGILEIEVTGTLENLQADGSVNCDNVTGSVIAGGSVTCDNVGGSVQAGGSVNCEDIGGSVMAGGSIHNG